MHFRRFLWLQKLIKGLDDIYLFIAKYIYLKENWNLLHEILSTILRYLLFPCKFHVKFHAFVFRLSIHIVAK